MAQKIRAIVLVIVGVVSLGLSIKCFTTDDLGYESRSMYGGDAYTGIQNAAATTSKNVRDLAGIVQFGFGSILLVMGLTLVGFGLTTPMGATQEKIDVVSPKVEKVSERTQVIENNTES
ncbi:MAG: hypothetical protein IKQ52_04935 [Bacteroidales bacterium]|nr:hypothetical protein [Bacteroidales bacterium]